MHCPGLQPSEAASRHTPSLGRSSQADLQAASCPLHTAIPWVGSGQDLRPRLPLARGEWCLVEGYEQRGLPLSAAEGIPFCSLAFWWNEPQSGH